MANEIHNEYSEIAECLQALSRTMETEWAVTPCIDIDVLASLTIEGKRLEAGINFKRQVRRSMLARLHEQQEFSKGHYGVPMILCTEYVARYVSI